MMARDELFARRVPRSSNGYQKDHEAISIDTYYDDERDRISRFNSSLDDMLSQGSDTLSSLRKQRETLKSAWSKVHDMAATLGLSTTVMRYIEKRASKDYMIFYILAFLFTLFMFLVWKFFL